MQFVCDQLGDATARRMFGGWGLYRGGAIAGIVHEGRVYAKATDEEHRRRFAGAGMGPFRPRPSQTMSSYWEVPVDAVDDAEALRSWFSPGAD